MNISIKYEGELKELLPLHPVFGILKGSQISKTEKRRWSRDDGKNHSHDIQTIFIGKTGYGKSTTVNAFFGRSIMETNDVASCTRSAQSFEFKIRNGHYFSFADLPGVGENQHRDEEYLALYSKIINKTDVVIYILRADMRDFSVDEAVCRKLFEQGNKNKVIFALNFCDKIEPINRAFPFTPSKKQRANIGEKITVIKKLFNPVNNVIPYSADANWNFEALATEIMKVINVSPEIRLLSYY